MPSCRLCDDRARKGGASCWRWWRFAMRWVTYISQDGGERAGLVIGDQIHGLAEPARLLDLLGDDGERLAEAGRRSLADPYEVLAYEQERLRAPIPAPPSIRDFLAFEK